MTEEQAEQFEELFAGAVQEAAAEAVAEHERQFQHTFREDW